MPLFTVTMRSNRSTNEKDRLSRAIHAASIYWDPASVENYQVGSGDYWRRQFTDLLSAGTQIRIGPPAESKKC